MADENLSELEIAEKVLKNIREDLKKMEDELDSLEPNMAPIHNGEESPRFYATEENINRRKYLTEQIQMKIEEKESQEKYVGVLRKGI